MPDPERLLVTSRLALEPIVPRHARHLFEYLMDDRLYRFHGGKPASMKQLEERFHQWSIRKSLDSSQIWLNYAVRRKNDNRYVGWIQATVTDAVAIIGYDIFVPYWRQGFAKEACLELIRVLFAEHGVTRVAAVVDTENIPSIRLLESLGFTPVWTRPSEDLPGREDYRYELQRTNVQSAIAKRG